MEIIKAGQEQIDQLYAIEQICFSDPWSYDSYKHLFDNEFNDVYAAFDNNNIIGFIVVMKMHPDAEILNICVLPEYRRRKVADSLLTYVVRYLEKNKYKTIFLEVRESNTPARQLYSKYG